MISFDIMFLFSDLWILMKASIITVWNPPKIQENHRRHTNIQIKEQVWEKYEDVRFKETKNSYMKSKEVKNELKGVCEK